MGDWQEKENVAPALVPSQERLGRWLVLVLSLSAVHLRQKRDQVIALSSRRTRRYRTHGVDIRRHCAGLHGDALHSVVMQQLHVIRLNAGVCQGRYSARRLLARNCLSSARSVIDSEGSASGCFSTLIAAPRTASSVVSRAGGGSASPRSSRTTISGSSLFKARGRRSIRIHNHETHSQLLQSGQGRARFVRQVRPNYANERRAGRFDQAPPSHLESVLGSPWISTILAPADTAEDIAGSFAEFTTAATIIFSPAAASLWAKPSVGARSRRRFLNRFFQFLEPFGSSVPTWDFVLSQTIRKCPAILASVETPVPTAVHRPGGFQFLNVWDF